jgi:hypothetical protein
MKNTYRQGDILFIQADKSIPTNGTASGTLEIAQGEVTGHAHILHAGVIRFLASMGNWLTHLDLPQGGTIRHDEHAPIELPPGAYEIRRQREYAYSKSVPADD